MEFISCDAQVHCLLRSQLNWIWVAGSAAGLGFMPSAGQLAHSPRFSHHWLVAPSFNPSWSSLICGIAAYCPWNIWDFSAVSRHARTRVATKTLFCVNCQLPFYCLAGANGWTLWSAKWRFEGHWHGEDNSALLDRMGQHSIVPFLPLIRILVVCRTMKFGAWNPHIICI